MRRRTERSRPVKSRGQRDAERALRDAEVDRRRVERMEPQVREVAGRLREARSKNHFAESISAALGGGRA